MQIDHCMECGSPWNVPHFYRTIALMKSKRSPKSWGVGSSPTCPAIFIGR